MATPHPPGPPTYGELYRAVLPRLDTAVTDGTGPFTSPQQARDAVLGYRRFLGVVGQHLRLLTGPGLAGADYGRTPLPALPDLLSRMTKLAGPTNTDSPWDAAAFQLGVAHDLLAGHFEAHGGPRTPDAIILTEPAVTVAATTRLLHDTTPALHAWRGLIGHADFTSRNGEVKPTGVISQLGQQLPAIRGLTSEILTTSNHAPHSLEGLDGITLADHIPASGTGRDFDDSLTALRVLTLICHRQAAGTENANPATLHGLTRLARHTLDRTGSNLPTPSTPVSRVRHAAARDALTTSSHAWKIADDAIGPDRIQGLVKAPGVYRDAIDYLDHHHDPAIDRAVLTALPRLGRQAGQTITELTATGALTRGHPQPGTTRVQWSQLSETEGQELASVFTHAAAESQRTTQALAALDTHPTTGPEPGRGVEVPTRARAQRRGRDGAHR